MYFIRQAQGPDTGEKLEDGIDNGNLVGLARSLEGGRPSTSSGTGMGEKLEDGIDNSNLVGLGRSLGGGRPSTGSGTGDRESGCRRNC